VPDQYDWGLWSGSENYQLPHSYVYYRDVSLEAGRTYHFLTQNLQPLTSANPDPVMYLVRGNDIVMFNDDYVGLASEIIYHTPSVDEIYHLAPDEENTRVSSGIASGISHAPPTTTELYRLVIRAYATATPGVCDVYQGVDGAPPALLDSNVMFGGTYVWVRWKLGEWFETGRPVLIEFGTEAFDTGGGVSAGPSDPYLFLIYPESAVGSKMYWNDDGAGFPDSRIEPPTAGTGAVILGSYARYSGGTCRLALVGQSYKAPWMSPGPWAFDAGPVAPTPTAARYLDELERQKPALNELSPDERDQRVLELQRQTLSEEEIRRQLAPIPAVSTELVRRQRLFLDRYGQLERDLAETSYGERAAKLAQVKRETMGREYSEPEGPLLREDEERDSGRGEAQ
jgi:hypothetical protein